MGTHYRSATVQDRDVADDPRFETVELFGYAYTLLRCDDETDLRAMLAHTGCSYAWAMQEADDRVQDRLVNPGETWKIDRALWERYLRRDGRFAYTYNERIRTQRQRAIEELRDRPNTRQAVITVYDRHDDLSNWGGVDRVPCSMHYQLAIREGKLCCVYVMRSCDFLKHFATDVYLACSLMRHVAREIGKPVGHLVHVLGSLHAFVGDMEKRGIF